MSSQYDILQIKYKEINNIQSKEITSASYEIIDEISCNLRSLKSNSIFKVNINFKYLSSTFMNSFLDIAIDYKINDVCYNYANYKLGDENTNFNYNLFNTTFYNRLTHSINDNINYYVKAKIHLTGSNVSISDIVYKPIIYFDNYYNTITVEELNISESDNTQNLTNITNRVDNNDRNILSFYKDRYNVANTSRNFSLNQESNNLYSNYVLAEDMFNETLPNNPINENYIVRKAEEIGLTQADFKDYSESNEINSSIVDFSNVRRFNNLKLQNINIVNPGESWYKLDNNGENVLKDAIQYNFNESNGIYPYNYNIYSEKSNNLNNIIPSNDLGGNWVFDIKSGIIIFNNFENFSNNVSINIDISNRLNITDNKPNITFYKYIGKKGVNLYQLIMDISNRISSS